jgi:hypothetical protein
LAACWRWRSALPATRSRRGRNEAVASGAGWAAGAARPPLAGVEGGLPLAAGAGERRGKSDRESGPGPGVGTASGTTAASASTSAGRRSGAGCRLGAGTDCRLRELEEARRLGRLANGTPGNWMSGQLPGSGAASVSKPGADADRPRSAGSEHRLGGGQLGEGGDEAVPAPTACVGDVCGATSCARRQLNHRMLWTARSLGHRFWPGLATEFDRRAPAPSPLAARQPPSWRWSDKSWRKWWRGVRR